MPQDAASYPRTEYYYYYYYCYYFSGVSRVGQLSGAINVVS